MKSIAKGGKEGQRKTTWGAAPLNPVSGKPWGLGEREKRLLEKSQAFHGLGGY